MKENLKRYNIFSIAFIILGIALILYIFLAYSVLPLPGDDDILIPLGISFILYGIARFFFRTFIQNYGRRIFGVWLVVAGMYCWIQQLVILPGMFGFMGGIMLHIFGVVMIVVDF